KDPYQAARLYRNKYSNKRHSEHRTFTKLLVTTRQTGTVDYTKPVNEKPPACNDDNENQITDYVNRLFREYRTTVHLYCFTRSPKGHCIHFIRISADLKVQKPILLIEAGMHAREWIAPAQAIYIIHQLVENPENYYLIKNNEWHIIPVFNPDGYEYSHETDVFWRKTRNTLLEPDCMGVDPNRNFPFKWYADYSNLAECSSYYGGPHSLSISETARFKDYVTRVKKRIRLYLSFHSHGNHILYPWGYTNVPIETKEKLHEIASDVKETIEAFGKYKYTIGSFNIIDNGFGLSTDWAMNDAKIDLVYTIVLPRCGPTGFHPKGDEILPILNQMFEGFSYKIYHVYPKKRREIKTLIIFDRYSLINLLNVTSDLELPMQILVQPENHDFIVSILTHMHVQYIISINDVSSVAPTMILPELTGTVTFKRIMRMHEINVYLDRIGTQFSDIVRVECLGKSFNGQCITVVKISGNQTAENPIILIEAGMHGREWIAPAQALYVINQLVENPLNKYLIKEVEWYIVPVLNPDGYEYSHNTDIFWQKTRNDLLNSSCIGIDPNKNFPFKWKITDKGPCSDYYSGTKPFTTNETILFKNFVLQLNGRVRLYLSFHSHGSFILYPWGYTNISVKNEEILRDIAFTVKTAIKDFGGIEYQVDSYNKVNPSFGLSTDWAKDVAKINLVYTIVLPASGATGFHPNPSDIYQIVDTTFQGIKLFETYV
ncbi:hypothetical protein RN001_009868, partial [Aquatica leii]